MERNIMSVSLLGGLTVKWNGQEIKALSDKRKSQDKLLFVLMMIGKDRQWARDELVHMIFGNQKLTDIDHTLQSVMYNLKRKLVAAGLPEINFIKTSSGVCRWTNDFDVVIDADILKKEYQLAKLATDDRSTLNHYMNILEIYKGEVLPDFDSEEKIIEYRADIKNIWQAALNNAVFLLKESKDYKMLESVGRLASASVPFENNECITMEALVEQGLKDEAVKLYEETNSFYLKKKGIKPSDELRNLLLSIRDELKESNDIDEMMTSMSLKEKYSHCVTYSAFENAFQMSQRIHRESKRSDYLILCEIADEDEGKITDKKKLEKYALQLVDGIEESIKSCDILCHYSNEQIYVLIVDSSYEDCERISKRISSKMRLARKRMTIKYSIRPVK